MERNEMAKVMYASIVDNLMYAIVCIRLDITHIAGVLSHYIGNPCKDTSYP